MDLDWLLKQVQKCLDLDEGPEHDAAYSELVAHFVERCAPEIAADLAQLREACATWQNHFTNTPGLAAANAEIVSLRSQLAAMTAARDEACGIIEKLARRDPVDESCVLCGRWLGEHKGDCPTLMLPGGRLEQLRKVGQ